jgi:hypothetical protein
VARALRHERRQLGYLMPEQESALAEAILDAYDLDSPE